jgi:hypothetical protein
VSFIAKFLNQKEIKPILEKKYSVGSKDKCDLFFNGKNVEFKFYFDFDIKLFEKENQPVKKLYAEIKQNGFNNWHVKPPIISDILIKNPDIFVWIISSRDISNLNDNDLENICYGNDQKKFFKNKNGFDMYKTIEDFLKELEKERSFKEKKATISLNGYLKTKYDFYFLNFL